MNKTGSVGEASFAREFQCSDLPYFGSFGVRNSQTSEDRKRVTSGVQNSGIGGVL
jgi:hypothetical protein